MHSALSALGIEHMTLVQLLCIPYSPAVALSEVDHFLRIQLVQRRGDLNYPAGHFCGDLLLLLQ